MYSGYYSRTAMDLQIWSYEELANGNRVKASKLSRIAQQVESRKRKSGVSGFPAAIPPSRKVGVIS